MKLTYAMNTYNPALEKISSLGYVVGIIANEEGFDWEARKNGDVFIASDPLRLLGLLSIGEVQHPVTDQYDTLLKLHFGNA